jgi:hypothetical protein
VSKPAHQSLYSGESLLALSAGVMAAECPCPTRSWARRALARRALPPLTGARPLAQGSYAYYQFYVSSFVAPSAIRFTVTPDTSARPLTPLRAPRAPLSARRRHV